MNNARKTIADVYEIAKRNPVVYAGLALYEQNTGRMPMFDALILIVCALAEENRVLKENAIWVVDHTVTSPFVRPSA